MSKKKLAIYIPLTIISIIILVASYFFIYKKYVSKEEGKIEVVLVDLDGTVVSEKEIEFKKNDTLEKLLKENYSNVVIKDGMLMSIDKFTTPTDWSRYISIYVDDEISNYGVLDIKFIDGTKISFVMVEYHE